MSDLAQESTKVVDPWDVADPESDEKAWEERTGSEKLVYVVIQIGKFACIIGLLYLFIVSLGLMGSAFKVLGGPSAGKVFREQAIFANPIAGLVLGILATVLVQSSSTSTSIIVTMTAAGLIAIPNAIPMIMGANIGTSVTNTILSLSFVGDKDAYRRGFAGATVHDCFNLLTVCVLLPVEVVTGFLRHLASALVEAFGIVDDQEKGEKVDFLKKITKPVSARLVQVDKKLVTKVALEDDPDELEKLLSSSMIKQKFKKDSKTGLDSPPHLFLDTSMDDTAAGVLLLFVSLVLLSVCLILLVKTLQSVFKGRAAIWMKGLLNLEFKQVPFVADYILIAFGAFITILMQSSSITTSTLTPLVAVGLIKLEKMFPFTVGANIGTTVTGILSALAGSNIATGMTVALSHLCFNLVGTLIWFPVPVMRRVPVNMAKVLGNLAADLRWFPVAYIAVVFVIIPCILLGFSLAGPAITGIFGTLLLGSLAAILLVLVLRKTRLQSLPAKLQADPAWLPPSLRVEPLPDAGDSQAAAASNADVNATKWWQGNIAWGSGWFVLMFLLLAVPTCQWGILKYSTDDGRGHFGIGAWTVCSKEFEHEVLYVSELDADMSAAGSDWAAGNLPFEVSYGIAGTQAWAAGDHCRPASDLCSGLDLSTSGNLATAGLVFCAVAQIALLSSIFMDGKRDVKPFHMGAFAVMLLSSVLLIASYATFSGSMSTKTSCTLIAPSGTGAITGTGNLGDMMKSGFSHDFVLYAFLLTIPCLAVMGHHLATMKKPAPAEASSGAGPAEVSSGAGEATTV